MSSLYTTEEVKKLIKKALIITKFSGSPPKGYEELLDKALEHEIYPALGLNDIPVNLCKK